MDYNLILSQSTELNLESKDISEDKFKQFESEMILKYNYLYENVNTIFLLSIKGTMDINMLKFMIKQASAIKTNSISNHDASVKVGNELVDKYVKPLIKK